MKNWRYSRWRSHVLLLGRYKVALSIFCSLSYLICVAQQTPPELPAPKRFIDKVEVFAGLGASFNYGNKFVENHKDEKVQNKRLLKSCYSIGLGLYHSLSDRFVINARLQYDVKGRKTELNTPYGDQNRIINYYNYDYQYLTVQIISQYQLSIKPKFGVGLGVYYSDIKGTKGHGKTYDTQGQIFSEGHYKGRYFDHLTSDGTIDSFTWIPGLKSFESFDLGIVASVRYTIEFNTRHGLDINLIDNLGLTNINKNKPYGLEERNHTISLVFAYTLRRQDKR